MIKVAGYGRMSTDKQQMSPAVQEQAVRDWFEYQTKAGKWDDGAEFVGMFVDKAVSSRIDLLDRPCGEHIITVLNPGDVIVAAKYNRAFRSAADAERTLARLNEAGILLVFLDLNIDTSTANGKLMAGVLAVVSEHERNLRSETTKDALAFRRRTGHAVCLPPWGWQIKNKRKSKEVRRASMAKMAPDLDERSFANAARKMLRGGASRLDAHRLLLHFHKKRNMKCACSEQSIVDAAAAASLGFPKQSITFVSKTLGFNVGTLKFTRRDDHKQVTARLHELLVEDGFDEAQL